jgi:hypothetical protein
MTNSNKSLLYHEILAQNVYSPDLWKKTMSWIKTNEWEIVTYTDPFYVKFNHLISSVRSYNIRTIEIRLDNKEDDTKISFNVFARSKYPDYLNALKYKEVIINYLESVGIPVSDDLLQDLYKSSEIDRLIRGNLFGVFLFNVFSGVLIFTAINDSVWWLFWVGVSSFVFSIPSIRRFLHYIDLKKRLF